MTVDKRVRLEGLTLETAAEHLVARVPVVAPNARAGDVRASLAEEAFESATHLAICLDGRLEGVLRIEDLLAARPETAMRDVMDADPPVVAPGTDQELVAWRAVQHGESSLAVVDEERRFLGFLPAHRLLAVLLHEHEEDMARLGGFLRGTSSARMSSEEPVLRRFWHRVPWLLVGLAGAVLSADIVGSFEEQLESDLLLAFFIPAIVYLADAVGTQTEALVIRGFSVGVDVRRVMFRELATGVLVGAALALAFLPIGLARWQDTDVMLTVSLSLFAACSMATIVAMILPYGLQRLGRDPAFGSGPVATVIQDLLSIVIYLGFATVFVG
jgi:magnesium transporter